MTFEQYLTNKAKSNMTIKSYTVHIEEYFKSYNKLARENIIYFKKQLQDKNQASTSINAKLSALKSYNEYLISEKKLFSLLVIPDDFIKIQKQSISPTKFDLRDIEEMFKKVKVTESKRNIALIYLLLSTGIRREESVNIELKNIDFKTGELNIIRGKGEKERTILLNDKVIEVLKDYMNTERKESRYSNSKYLFITIRSSQMEKGNVNKIMKPYKINPHALRHFFASNALKNGMDVVEVGNMLGHTSITTTSKYLHPTMKEMKKKINNLAIGF